MPKACTLSTTNLPGLAAKPVIDLMAAVDDLADTFPIKWRQLESTSARTAEDH